jgi:hypothetical protein
MSFSLPRMAAAAMAVATVMIWTSLAQAWATCGSATCFYGCTCTGYLQQVNGCPIPQMKPGGSCGSDNVQACFDQAEGSRTIDACADASTDPQTFIPTCALTFKHLAQGGIIHLTFGWYNVTGTKPTAADLHPFLTDVSKSTVGTVGVLAILSDPAYKGGEIGFYTSSNREGTFYSERKWNTDCPNQIHSLVWHSVVYSKRFYFGWEDLACGGDDDFDEPLMSVEGIFCSGGGAVCDTGKPGVCGPGHMQCSGGGLKCLPDQSPGKEVCNAVDDNCDGNIDEPNPDLCPNLGDICDRGVCVRPCGGGEFVCTGSDVCNSRGLCVDPLCVDKTCPPGQVCKAGVCGDGCQGVTCPAGQKCWLGRCVDPCAGKVCDTGYKCQDGVCQNCSCEGCAAGLTCINNACVDTACSMVTCPSGQHCDAGNCIDNCQGVVCPNGEVCMNGQCPGSIGTAGAGGGQIIINPDGGIVIINPGTGGTGGTGTAGATSSSGGTGTVVLPDGSVVPATGGSGATLGTAGARATSKDEASCGCRIAGSRWAGNLAALAALGLFTGLRFRRRLRLTRAKREL